MNQHSSIRRSESLLERASEAYDFRAAIRAPVMPDVPATEQQATAAPEPINTTAAPEQTTKPVALRPSRRPSAIAPVDREKLRQNGFLLPDAPVNALAEEFRIIKRQLLLNLDGLSQAAPGKRQTILVCSAQPDDGKTFCALNLALSLAGERDVEALLVDGDFAKPEILSLLGIPSGPGLIDAIADPGCDPNDLVVGTDIDGLSVLPAGAHANNVTELLASARTRDVLAALTRDNSRRVIVFDSPPALMASPASVLAGQVGQVLLVVRADQTAEADLKEAVGLLSGCENLSLMLNGAGFAASSRRFGAYYGYGR